MSPIPLTADHGVHGSANILKYQRWSNTYNTNIYATGTITIGGSIANGDVITVTIGNIAALLLMPLATSTHTR